jgi:hypothetical protein
MGSQGVTPESLSFRKKKSPGSLAALPPDPPHTHHTWAIVSAITSRAAGVMACSLSAALTTLDSPTTSGTGSERSVADAYRLPRSAARRFVRRRSEEQLLVAPDDDGDDSDDVDSTQAYSPLTRLFVVALVRS